MQWYLWTLAEIINQAGWPIWERVVPSSSTIMYGGGHGGRRNVLAALLSPLIIIIIIVPIGYLSEMRSRRKV